MSKQEIHALGALCRLRQEELDQLQDKLAKRRAEASRYQQVIQQLDQLNAPASASSPLGILSANHGQYKAQLMEIKNHQTQELSYVKQQLQLAQSQVLASWQTLESLKEVRQDLLQDQTRLMTLQEQKYTDGIATQAWLRRQQSNRQAMEG